MKKEYNPKIWEKISLAPQVEQMKRQRTTAQMKDQG